MLKADDPKARLALITGQRLSAEQLLGSLRQHLANWRGEEAKRNQVSRALLWSYTELWATRIEALATSVEQHVGTLRQHEQLLTQEAEAEVGARRKKRRRR